MKEQVTALIVGCGHRAREYAETAINYSDKFKIVAIVDPDEHILELNKVKFNVPDNMCFRHIDEVLKLGKIADCVINGTMDNLHIETSIPFLKQGYDLLLEKPITNNAADLLKLKEIVDKYHNKVLVCHVLRYSDFYKEAKKAILNGEIGEVVHIETTERVGVAHNCISYIRGKWNNEQECGSSMLLAKCSHDIDLICWFNNATKPKKVSSFGGRNFIIPEKAPKESGSRCLVDCPLVETCQYSAKMMCLESNDYLGQYPWQCTGKEWYEVSNEERIESLKTYNPHGLCAYKTNANVVDHQAVMIEFENGSTATHGLLCSAQRAGRSFYILGTHGEIEGWGGDGKIYIRTFDEVNRDNIDVGKERIIDFNNNDQSEAGGHFGGDELLAHDFVDYMLGAEPSISCTSLDDSINGHLCVYAADLSRVSEKVVYLEELVKNN